MLLHIAGVDPGFLERGFIYIKMWGGGGGGGGFALLSYLLFLKYPMKMK